MKKTLFLIIMITIFAGLSAQNSGFGLGIILAEPTGLSAKIWTGKTTAFDAAAAWSFKNDGALYLHGDMLFHNFDLINQSFPVYYGIGARVKLEDDFNEARPNLNQFRYLVSLFLSFFETSHL